METMEIQFSNMSTEQRQLIFDKQEFIAVSIGEFLKHFLIISVLQDLQSKKKNNRIFFNKS